jgi:hypothetical protein
MTQTEPENHDAVPIPIEEWNRHVTRVTEEMKEFTKPFVTPLSKVIDNDYGELWGTGNYVELLQKQHLLTNEHVAQILTNHSIGHQFLDNDSVFRATNPFSTFGWPIDAAVSVIDERVWTSQPHHSQPIPESKWALAHAPVQGEILFLKGYSGAESRFLFGTLQSRATSYCCQQIALPPGDDDFNSRFHFAIDYRPDRATPLDGRDLPTPPGFSGSLVWNTRFVERSLANRPWSPDCAQVTGLVWGWPSSEARLVATRVEYARSFLLGVISGRA